jgi:hypothetical protein
MADESQNSTEMPMPVGDRPESNAPKENPDSTAGSSVRDELPSLLTNRRRRYVLYCLKTSEMPMTLANLADGLVRRETDASPTAVQDERERIYVSLYHTHLPKLAEADLVSFDTDQNLVDLREEGEALPLDLVRAGAEEQPH